MLPEGEPEVVGEATSSAAVGPSPDKETPSEKDPLVLLDEAVKAEAKQVQSKADTRADVAEKAATAATARATAAEYAFMDQEAAIDEAILAEARSTGDVKAIAEAEAGIRTRRREIDLSQQQATLTNDQQEIATLKQTIADGELSQKAHALAAGLAPVGTESAADFLIRRGGDVKGIEELAKVLPKMDSGPGSTKGTPGMKIDGGQTRGAAAGPITNEQADKMSMEDYAAAREADLAKS